MATLTTADHNINRLADDANNGHDNFYLEVEIKFTDDGDIILSYMDMRFLLKVKYDD